MGFDGHVGDGEGGEGAKEDRGDLAGDSVQSWWGVGCTPDCWVEEGDREGWAGSRMRTSDVNGSRRPCRSSSRAADMSLIPSMTSRDRFDPALLTSNNSTLLLVRAKSMRRSLRVSASSPTVSPLCSLNQLAASSNRSIARRNASNACTAVAWSCSSSQSVIIRARTRPLSNARRGTACEYR